MLQPSLNRNNFPYVVNLKLYAYSKLVQIFLEINGTMKLPKEGERRSERYAGKMSSWKFCSFYCNGVATLCLQKVPEI